MAGLSETYPINQIQPEAVWKRFMPQLAKLNNLRTDHNLYAVQEFDHQQLNNTTPPKITLWAAVPVKKGGDTVPEPFEHLSIAPGVYAVFLHKGPASALSATLKEIFENWMPESGYQPDARPHMQVMDPEYKGHLHPEAEEEVWVPIRPK